MNEPINTNEPTRDGELTEAMDVVASDSLPSESPIDEAQDTLDAYTDSEAVAPSDEPSAQDTPSLNDAHEGVAAAAPAKERRVDTVFDLVEMITLTLIAVLVLTVFLFRHSIVDGASMESTLHDGDHLILYSLFYEPKVGDIIVFEDYSTPLKKPLVKRIIATEGQTVTVLSDTEVRVDGVLIEGGFVDGASYEYTYPITYTVPEGYVYVMGDHRNNSTDSRSFEGIRTESILGKVILRIYPLKDFGVPGGLPNG